MVHLGLCFFILHLRSRSYGTPVSTYHFCNFKLTFLRYELFHTSCVNLWQICHTFHFLSQYFIFSHNLHVLFYNQYILVYLLVFYCYSMARKRELKMSELPPLSGGRWEECVGWKLEELNRPDKIKKQRQVIKYKKNSINEDAAN